MIPIIALWSAAFAALTSVKGLSVLPVEDRTEVVIEVDGPVTIKHFTLESPHRLVVDISTAQPALPQSRFGNIDRGGVRGLRVAQFQPGITRVVVDLAGPVAYRVDQRSGEVRVSFPNPGGAFTPWHSAGRVANGAGPAADPTAAAFVAQTNGRAADRPEGRAAATGAPAAATEAPAASRTQAPGSTRGAAAERPLPRIQPIETRPEPAITVFFKDTNILDVLATFAEFSGRSIVPGTNVSGKVTADIRNQPWDIALAAILQAHGLAAQELESGILRVEKMSELRVLEASEPLVTEHFRIKYALADSAFLQTVKGLLSDSIATVTINPATNTVVVTDRESVVRNRIAPMIEQLDVRTPQVTIAAKIIFVDRTSLEELGVVYDIKDSRGNQINRLIPGGIDTDGDGVISPNEQTNQNVVRLGGPSFAALANAEARVTKPQLQLLTTLALGRYSLINFVEALSSLTVTDVRASPVISTLDNRTARVHVGERTPIRVLDAGTQGGGGGGTGGGGGGGAAAAPMATVRFEDTGVILEVTPHVTGDQVLLRLHAERSNIAVAPSDIGYTFMKQATDTEILLNDGETAVISGMTIIEKSENRSGIPILKDIPVLGALFRTTVESETKKDLLIMVTPHIIRDGEA